MAYEIYKNKLKKEEYFKVWDEDSVKKINESLRDQVYGKYLLRCEVYNRDGFKCQNIKCITPKTELTMHHIKWKKNGGLDKIRNCVTLCKTCHEAFNRAETEIKFGNADNLPPHIKGHTFKMHKAIKEELEWKQLKADMRKYRKTVKQHHGITLNWQQVELLLKWLEMAYYNSRKVSE